MNLKEKLRNFFFTGILNYEYIKDIADYTRKI